MALTTYAAMITESYLKDNTPLTSNIDVAELYPFMKDTQTRYVQNLLGTKFYNHLMDAITANSLTTDEVELMKMVRSMLMWYICYDAIPFINIKLRNKGVLKGSGDNLVNAELSEMKWLMNMCKGHAEFYEKRLQEYLCVNGSKFPTYQNPDMDMYPDKNTGYTCGIVLDHYDDIQKLRRRYLL